jgi:hypothetical protein
MARLARSLETLRAEVNRWAPKRSKASDGWIGDPAHASRASRHNPNNAGVVCALDLTHDPKGGCDIHALARRLVRDPHPELEYVISNGQVAKRRNGFRWESYGGSNPHRQHVHFAVGKGPDSEPTPPYDSTRPWGVAATEPEPSEEDDDMPVYVIHPAYDSNGEGIVLLQGGKLSAVADVAGLGGPFKTWDLRKSPNTWRALVRAVGGVSPA